jgi:hypothetical protein
VLNSPVSYYNNNNILYSHKMQQILQVKQVQR